MTGYILTKPSVVHKSKTLINDHLISTFARLSRWMQGILKKRLLSPAGCLRALASVTCLISV